MSSQWRQAQAFNLSLRYMTPEKRQQVLNEHRRINARGLCTKCKVEPRSSTMSICKKCNCERRKKDAKRFYDLAKVKEADRFLKGRCCICRIPFTGPRMTKNRKVKLTCGDCWRRLFDIYRVDKLNKLTWPGQVVR